MKDKHKIYLLLILFTGFLAGCKLNEDKEWDVDLLAPVANAELTIDDLLKDSSIQKNADNSLTLVQVMKLKDLNVGDIIKVGTWQTCINQEYKPWRSSEKRGFYRPVDNSGQWQ